MTETATPTLAIVVAMAAVTYLLRVGPLLGTHAERIPRVAIEYLRLVAPAILAALAAVNVAVLVRTESTGARIPSFQIGIEWLAVLLCVAVVAVRRSLILGLVAAVLVAALGRLAGGTPGL
jgi:branched-subunit amino acid transport protein